MKKLFTTLLSSAVLVTSLATFSTAANATIRDSVKNYTQAYVNMLQHIKNKQTANAGYLISGSYNDLNSVQLTAAIEVLQLVADGDLDACCWTGNTDGTLGNAPNVYPGMPSVSGADLMDPSNGSQKYYYQKSNNTVPTNWFTTGSDIRNDYVAMKAILDIAWDVSYNNTWQTTDNQKMKYYEHRLGDLLRFIWTDLKWGFSYVDSSLYNDLDLQWDFRSKYAFACVVCFGAGFYDTSLLHDIVSNPDGTKTATAKSAYTAIYNSTKISTATRNWMATQSNNQYPDTYNWVGPAGQSLIDGTPLQVSMGPTMQASVGSVRGNFSSDKHVYPTHCHGSTELYKVLNPMQIIDQIGTATQHTNAIAALPYTNNSGIDPYSYITQFGTANFVENMYNAWTKRLIAGDPDYGSFLWTGQTPGTDNLGGMFYNGEADYHAMHNGPWFQLTQWARLTSPAEGTFFPLHTTNISPSSPNGDGCNAS
jgi:hypothetical protein